MRHRLYFVLPNLKAAQQTMNDLLLARIEERHIHCLARRDAPMDGLHEANVLQKTDVVHGAETGIALGGIAGVVLGAIAVFGPLESFHLQMVTILFVAIGGAVFGAWMSSLKASSLPNSKLLAFARDIENGCYLMMADVPARRVGEIRSLVEKGHPEAIQGGEEPAIPAFP
jgi:hypothetical protein